MRNWKKEQFCVKDLNKAGKQLFSQKMQELNRKNLITANIIVNLQHLLPRSRIPSLPVVDSSDM